MSWENGSLVTEDRNPSTRLLAYQQVRNLLREYATRSKRILIGFDFAYAYPTGFAAAIHSGRSQSWLEVWEYINARVQDDVKNHNNRFTVASELNAMLSGEAGPFWGCPENQSTNTLSMRKPRTPGMTCFPEFRLTEQGTSAHSVWKLAYPGAVGSQVLTGLPYLFKLISDPVLRKVSRVWPFETGLTTLTRKILTGIYIVHAEIYPSLVTVSAGDHDIKDRLQVNALAQYIAELDHQGLLGRLFAGSGRLDPEQKKLIEKEEGWILGVY